MNRQQFDNSNRGVLFKNEDKQSENHADYRGNIDIDGRQYWLNGWINESKTGVKYLSLSVKPKERAKAKPTEKSSGVPRFGDDVPFLPERRG